MATHKCRKCIWSDKISSNILYCIFPRCILKDKLEIKGVNKNDKASGNI
ncbi:hypothetical protein KPL37_19025 [Clostridium frigoris]|uniref:Uncharacterized protein n=1 Tax=Clostridium frigoris TaxID=205327 RepID=A0ABS6BYX4_9CLOT|nr:hypothetical protein [Clostridium frigoris]MBU3161781.1 hypothetical protein [Clostridium frigoris]